MRWAMGWLFYDRLRWRLLVDFRLVEKKTVAHRAAGGGYKHTVSLLRVGGAPRLFQKGWRRGSGRASRPRVAAESRKSHVENINHVGNQLEPGYFLVCCCRNISWCQHLSLSVCLIPKSKQIFWCLTYQSYTLNKFVCGVNNQDLTSR